MDDLDDLPPLPPMEAYRDDSKKSDDAAAAKRAAQIASFRMGIFCASDLDGQPIPPRVWHVQDFIPSDTVTLFGGDGGTGKSLLALQLAASTALDHAWLGLGVRPGRAVYLSAEDDKAELHRRLADIAQAEGVTLEKGEASLRKDRAQANSGPLALLENHSQKCGFFGYFSGQIDRNRGSVPRMATHVTK